MSEGLYYTTQEVVEIVGLSAQTIFRRVRQGKFPKYDLESKPHKWLKSKIDAMIEVETDTEDEA